MRVKGRESNQGEAEKWKEIGPAEAATHQEADIEAAGYLVSLGDWTKTIKHLSVRLAESLPKE